MRDFLYSMDKQRSGLVPSSNFMKIMRVFGVPIPPGHSMQLINNHTLSNGMVEYDKIVEIFSNTYA